MPVEHTNADKIINFVYAHTESAKLRDAADEYREKEGNYQAVISHDIAGHKDTWTGIMLYSKMKHKNELCLYVDIVIAAVKGEGAGTALMHYAEGIAEKDSEIVKIIFDAESEAMENLGKKLQFTINKSTGTMEKEVKHHDHGYIIT